MYITFGGYNSAQEERLGINACDVPECYCRVFLVCGLFCYNYRQHTLVEPCFFLRAYQKQNLRTEKPTIPSLSSCAVLYHTESEILTVLDCLITEKKNRCRKRISDFLFRIPCRFHQANQKNHIHNFKAL